MTTQDLNSFKDLQEHFSNFSLIVHQLNHIKTEKSNISKSLEHLTSEVESLRTSEKHLTEQLQTVTKTYQKEDSINCLYLKLKDKHVELEKKCIYFVQQNNSLQEKSLTEVTELEENFKCDKNKVIQDFEQKLRKLEEQLVEERTAFLKQENELYNELQMVQVSNARQCEESQTIEKSLRLQLKDAVNSHNSLRQDYLLFKTRNQTELETAKKTINDLKSKLRFTEQQLHISQEQSFKLNAKIETPPAVQQVVSEVCSLKYNTLTVNGFNASKGQNLQEKFNKEPLPTPVSTFNATTKTLNINAHGIKAYLPPLKQLSKINYKKRKLYKPGNVDFKNFDEIE